MKLYRSTIHPRHWVAYVPGSGWQMFPNKEHGWEERQPARGLDPMHLRQVALDLASGTGIAQHESELAEVA